MPSMASAGSQPSTEHAACTHLYTGLVLPLRPARRALSPSGPQPCLNWVPAAHEPQTVPGSPLCFLGVSAIAMGCDWSPNHCLEGQTLLTEVCGAGMSRGRSKSAPLRPS